MNPNRSNRSVHAENIRAAWIAADNGAADMRARMLANDARAAQIIAEHRAMKNDNAKPRGFMRLLWSVR